jgi:hypothetical protein
MGMIFHCAFRVPLKPNGRKSLAGQIGMPLSIGGKKSKEAAAKPCARSRWLTFQPKNDSRELGLEFHDAICAMTVVIAMPVANAKARAIPTKIFFMIVLRPSYLDPADKR